MKRCWNCNDPIDIDSFKDICRSCERRMREEDARDDERERVEDTNERP